MKISRFDPCIGGDANASKKRIYHILKRAFDIVFSLVCLIVFFLPMLMIAVSIRLDSPGPAFYVHERMGRNYRKFRLYKFRTMRNDADEVKRSFSKAQREEWKRSFKLQKDPRVTRVGSFLRSASLDELPQLWNILKGDMSFVGPRPVVEAELEYYGDERDRLLSVTPGLTGYWQAYARNTCPYTQRVRMELYYVEHASISLDLRILFATVGRVLSRKGAV